MGGACSSFTTSSSPTIYSTSVTDSKAMQVESCSSAVGVSNRGVSEKQLTGNTVQQHPSTPKRHTVLYISPPPEDLLDNSRMSCQDEGCGLESEQSCSMWMEDSPSNFSNMSTSSYNDNTECQSTSLCAFSAYHGQQRQLKSWKWNIGQPKGNWSKEEPYVVRTVSG